jgi:DNA-binding response OmpR family regulator
MPIHVLLTDDEPEFVAAIARVLARRGMAVRTAADGREALALSAAERFDVIVLDLRMPDLDGVETLRALRERGCDTPVLLLSAHADLSNAAAALREGASDYLVKPCAIEALVTAIEDANERSAALRDLLATGPTR